MKKIILLAILFFNLIPVLKKGEFSLTGPESAFADNYGDENGNNNDYSDFWSHVVGIFGTGEDFGFRMDDGSIWHPELDEVIVTEETVNTITNLFPDFVPEDPTADPEDIYLEFLDWYEEQPVDCAGVPGGSAIYNPNCGCIGGTTGFTICPPDCDDSKKINEKMANTTLSNQHAQV